MKTKYLVIGLVCLITACSNPKKPKPAIEDFTMYISENGNKHFQLRMEMKNKKNGNKTKLNKNGGKQRNKNRNMGNYDFIKNNKQNSRTDARIKFHLAKTSYCREGYIETNSFKESAYLVIQGRCHEKASIKDKKKLSKR